MNDGANVGTHEVRAGMSTCWIRTKRNEDGEVDWWADSLCRSGTASDLDGAFACVRQAMRDRERGL